MSDNLGWNREEEKKEGGDYAVCGSDSAAVSGGRPAHTVTEDYKTEKKYQRYC